MARDLATENAHLREALETIHTRISRIRRPNGTTLVIDRVAVAGLCGSDIEAAAVNPRSVA